VDYRRYCRWAEWTLVATLIGLHGAVFCWSEDPSQPNFVLVAAHDAQLLSAIVLILGWVVLGPGRWWIRVIASPVLVGLWFLPWNAQMQPRELAEGFIAAFCCAAAVLICGLRAMGFSVAKLPSNGEPERGAQFSLLSLIVAMTAIAMTIGLLEALRPTLSSVNTAWYIDSGGPLTFAPPSARIGEEVRLLVAAWALAFACVGGLWVVLRPGGMWLRLAALPVLIAAGGSYLAHLSGWGDGYFVPTALSLAIAFAAVAGMCGLSVLPLRLMNYRLQHWPRPRGASIAKSTDLQPLAERAVAAGVLVTISLLGSWPVATALRGDSRRYVNFLNRDFGIIVPFSTSIRDQIAPPLSACGQWIEFQSVSPWNRLTWLIQNTITPNSSGPWIGIEPRAPYSNNLSIITGSGQFVIPQEDAGSESNAADGTLPAGATTSGGMF
jgi:hypothetical protein